MSGKVVHFEIPADDIKRAQSFYKKAFGWRIDSVPGMGYAMVGTTPSDKNGMPTEPGSINGGMLTRQGPVKSPVITILVDDMDAALENLTELGGKVVRKKETVGDMGYAAYFKDTEGNVVGLWEPSKR